MIRDLLNCKLVKVDKTFILNSGCLEQPFSAVTMNSATVSKTLLETQRRDLNPKHIVMMGSSAPSLHNRREVSQKTAWRNVQIEHNVNDPSTVQCI